MTDRDWLVLHTLYEQKNMTAAARILYLSQPALTHRMQQMEKEFGVQIIIRERRGIQFTVQGEYLAKCAKEMMDRTLRIKENVLNMENTITGTLRLGVSTFFTDYKLPALLTLFKEKYPHVEFKVTTDWSSEIAHLIYNQDVHIGLVKGDYGWKGEQHLLFTETLCVASKEKIDLADLPKLPRIDYRTDPNLKAAADNWWREHYMTPPLISIDVDKAGTCKNMVASGLGYAILPSMLLNDLPGLYKIDLKTNDGKPITRNSWMLYHGHSLQLKMVKAFVEFIAQTDVKQLH